MYRLLQSRLLSWKNQKTRKPVLLDGARQVGKTYLLKNEFGEKYFPRVHVVDFMKRPDAKILFDADLSPQTILNNLSVFLNANIDPTNDLILFDEIGECPKALQSLKFVAEDKPDWFICSSGSNIGLLTSFPVGKVDGFTLRPMNFQEFLLANDNHALYKAFQEQDRTEFIHSQLWPILIDFVAVGGMPEVVDYWFGSRNEVLNERRQKVKELQANILANYHNDFGKYSGKVNSLHIEKVFENIPVQLQTNIDGSAKRYKFKDVIPQKRGYREFETIISWLEKTHLVSKSYIVNTPKVPLKAFRSESVFKLFFVDIGLLSCDLGLTDSVLSMGDVLFKGPIMENFVQNELLSYGSNETYSWAKNTAQIEFLIQTGERVIPVEVKAGKNTKAKSLAAYRTKYQPIHTVKLIGSVGETDDSDIVLPLYFSTFLKTLGHS